MATKKAPAKRSPSWDPSEAPTDETPPEPVGEPEPTPEPGPEPVKEPAPQDPALVPAPHASAWLHYATEPVPVSPTPFASTGGSGGRQVSVPETAAGASWRGGGITADQPPPVPIPPGIPQFKVYPTTPAPGTWPGL
jgi:hypothetical protein